MLPCCGILAPERANVRPDCASALLWPCSAAGLFAPPFSTLAAVLERKVCGRHGAPVLAPKFAWVAHAFGRNPRRYASNRRSVPVGSIRWPCRQCLDRGADRQRFPPAPPDDPNSVASPATAAPA